MAYLTLFINQENKSANISTVNLITGEEATQAPISLLDDNSGSNVDTCSFYSGPSDAAIMAFGASSESTGTVASSDSGSYGSIACSGGCESTGSIAFSTGSSSGSSSVSSCCSYSC